MRNVSHIAVGVRDMDVSLPFWTDVVGLHVTLDTIEEFNIGGEPVRRRGVYLRESEGPDEPFVVLDQQLTRTPEGRPKPLFEVGVHHFGFWVDDIDAVHARAKDAGVAVMVKPSEEGADEPPTESRPDDRCAPCSSTTLTGTSSSSTSGWTESARTHCPTKRYCSGRIGPARMLAPTPPTTWKLHGLARAPTPAPVAVNRFQQHSR